jgi:RNA polymerase sigma factor (TIGR02999 family)
MRSQSPGPPPSAPAPMMLSRMACAVSGSAPEPITHLLSTAGSGDREALDRVFCLVYDELRRLAEAVRRDRPSETLNATALVHEAYLKMVPSANQAWQDRVHFLRVAARAMRQVLADAAARQATQKRGGGLALVTLDSSSPAESTLGPDDILDLHRALDELAELNPRQAEVVECRFFAGLSLAETADALGVSVPTVTRDWRFARAWLARRLRER